MGKLDDAIARFRSAQTELLDCLRDGGTEQDSEIGQADRRLEEAFETILDDDDLDGSQRVARIGFLLNFLISRSDQELVITRVCDRIYGDAERLGRENASGRSVV